MELFHMRSVFKGQHRELRTQNSLKSPCITTDILGSNYMDVLAFEQRI